MGEENDITDYILFRSTDGENFEELTGGLYSLNYWDRDVEKETKYRYRVQVRDRAGNISEASQIVEAILPEDTLPTEIRSFAPENGSVIGQSNSEFKVLVSDNRKLSSVVVKYHMEGEEEEHILLEETAIQDYYMLLSAEMPVSELKDGDKIYLSVAVTDL